MNRPVSLIVTVFNEESTVESLLESVAVSSELPAEFVIVDGGSSDKTADKIAAWSAKHPELNIRLVRSEKRINIAAGRNMAVRAAKHDVIAAIDGGCTAHPKWLENLVAPFFGEDPPDVVSGWYEPIVENDFHARVARSFVPRIEDVDPETFLPSSRSIAFTKQAWALAGGYPEELRFAGEDTLFDVRMKNAGCRFRFAPDAVVYWRLRDDKRTLMTQYYKYGFGDGEAGLSTGTYLFRLAVCAFPPLMLATGKGATDFWLRYQVYGAITWGWLRGMMGRRQ